MLQVKAYDGSWDPLDHFESFKIFMHLQGVLDEIMYRAFLTTLKGPARIWFNKLTPKVQKILSGHTKHYTTGRWKPKFICDPFQQRGPPNWRIRQQISCYYLHLWVGTGGVSLLPLQEWPKENGWNTVQGHKIHERRRRDDSPRGEAKEETKTRQSSSRQRRVVVLNKWANGWKEIETPIRKDDKLHPLEHLAGSSLHANKGRRGVDMARQAEGRPKQKASEKVLSFPLRPQARYLRMLRPQVVDQSPYQVGEIVAIC